MMAEILPKKIINLSRFSTYYRKKCIFIIIQLHMGEVKDSTKMGNFPQTSYTNRGISTSSTFHSQFTLVQPVSFGNPGRRCRTCQLFYVDDLGNLILIVNTHSGFFRKLTHILVTVPCQIPQSWALGRWKGGGKGGGEEDKI